MVGFTAGDWPSQNQKNEHITDVISNIEMVFSVRLSPVMRPGCRILLQRASVSHSSHIIPSLKQNSRNKMDPFNLKTMPMFFWNSNGVLLMEYYLPKGTTITADVYCKMLKNLRWAIQNEDKESFLVSLFIFMIMPAPMLPSQSKLWLTVLDRRWLCRQIVGKVSMCIKYSMLYMYIIKL